MIDHFIDKYQIVQVSEVFGKVNQDTVELALSQTKGSQDVQNINHFLQTGLSYHIKNRVSPKKINGKHVFQQLSRKIDRLSEAIQMNNYGDRELFILDDLSQQGTIPYLIYDLYNTIVKMEHVVFYDEQEEIDFRFIIEELTQLFSYIRMNKFGMGK